jgi:hypothetical protein
MEQLEAKNWISYSYPGCTPEEIQKFLLPKPQL